MAEIKAKILMGLKHFYLNQQKQQNDLMN